MNARQSGIGEHTLSAVDDIVWPALPGRDGAMLLSVLFQLEQSQWWPADKLRARQFGQIERLCQFARRNIPFLAARLDAAGIAADTPLGDENWSRLPVLTRDELQQAGAKLQCSETPKGHGRTAQLTTTGSTGKPVSVRRTELTNFYWTAFTLRAHLFTEGGYCALFREGMKLGGRGGVDDAIAAACAEIHDEEFDHMM